MRFDVDTTANGRAVLGPPLPCVRCGHPAVVRHKGQPCHVLCLPGNEAIAVATPGYVGRVQEPVTVTSATAYNAPVPSKKDTPRDLDAFATVIRQRWPDEEPTDEDIVAGVAAFERATDGTAWIGRPTRVGQLLFERVCSRYGSIPNLERADLSALHGIKTVRQYVLSWVDPNHDTTAHEWVLGTDVNGAYLAVTGNVELGTGEPDHLGGQETTTELLKVPGYARLAEVSDKIAGPCSNLKSGDVLPMPYVKYLAERGWITEVAEVWVWPKVEAGQPIRHRRWLNSWGTVLRKGRATLMAEESVGARYGLAAVKAVYQSFLGGWLASERFNASTTLRPDWRDMVHSSAHANMLRSLAEATPRPFAVTMPDAAYFPATGPDDLPAGLTFCDQLGKWKRHRYAHLGDTWVTADSKGRERKHLLADEVNRAVKTGRSAALNLAVLAASDAREVT
jgi:hypothetical protein